MPTSDDDMSLREIGRTLADFRNEMRQQLSQLVRNDVYRAEQAALQARIVSLEEAGKREDASKEAGRRQLQGAFYMAIASLAVAVIVGALAIGG